MNKLSTFVEEHPFITVLAIVSVVSEIGYTIRYCAGLKTDDLKVINF